MPDGGLKAKARSAGPRLPPARGKRERGRRAHPVDGHRERAEPGARPRRTPRASSPSAAEREPEVEHLELDRAELDVDRDVDGERRRRPRSRRLGRSTSRRGCRRRRAMPPSGRIAERNPSAPERSMTTSPSSTATSISDVAGRPPGRRRPRCRSAPTEARSSVGQEPGAAGDAEQRHRLPPSGRGRRDPDAGAARDLGGGRRVDAQLARRQHVDGGAGFEGARRGRPRAPSPGRSGTVTSSCSARSTRSAARRPGIGSSVRPMSTMPIRSTGGPPAGPGCTKANVDTRLANRASRSSSSSSQSKVGDPSRRSSASEASGSSSRSPSRSKREACARTCAGALRSPATARALDDAEQARRRRRPRGARARGRCATT